MKIPSKIYPHLSRNVKCPSIQSFEVDASYLDTTGLVWSRDLYFCHYLHWLHQCYITSLGWVLSSFECQNWKERRKSKPSQMNSALYLHYTYIIPIKHINWFSYLVTIVNCNFAMFAWDSWKLNSNIAVFTSTQKALWAHQRKNTAIEASTTDYHDGSVERHIDLKFSLKFLTFFARGLFFSSYFFFEFESRSS